MGADVGNGAAQRKTRMLVQPDLDRVTKVQHAQQGVIVLVTTAAEGSPACCTA